MIDYHIVITAAGPLFPAQAIRLARSSGLRAAGLILRTDTSLLGPQLAAMSAAVRKFSIYADIEAFLGVELVQVPPALLPEAVAEARALGASLVLGHGEGIPDSPVEAVEAGSNFAAIAAGVDILAQPGLITAQDAEYAAQKGVLLELTLAWRHCLANGHVAAMARRFGCGLVPGSAAASPRDFLSPEAAKTLRRAAALGAGLDNAGIADMEACSHRLLQQLLSKKRL